MSREIKFRVWTGAEMEYNVMSGKFGTFYVNPSNNGLDEKDSACLTPFNTKYSDAMPVMQFTGFTDKNGKEIFEGDVIKFKVDFPEQEFDNGLVRWAKGGYWTSQIENDLEELLSEELSDLSGEIIGNIFQNPELVSALGV